MVASFVGSHAATDGLGGDALANLDVGLFDDHAALTCLASAATVLCSQHPFSVGVGELADWDDADSSLVVAAVTWAKADTPSGLEMC